MMLCLLVSSHAINECPSGSLFGTSRSHFCGVLLVILCFKWPPQPSAEGLSRVSRCRKAMIYIMEKILVLDRLR